MSASAFQTDNIFLAAFLIFVHTDASEHYENVTKRVEFPDGPGTRRVVFTLDVPCGSEDARIYEQEFNEGQLSISDLKSFVDRYQRLSAVVRKMNNTGVTIWEAPVVRSDAWWSDARVAVQQRRSEREVREQREQHRERRRK